MARYRRSYRPQTFAVHGNMRIMSLICMLVVLAMLYQRAADPHTWGWLAALDERPRVQVDAQPGAVGKAARAPLPEVIVPGPGADDPDEQQAIGEEFQAVADRAPLDAAEMPAYWRLMRWSRTQSFADLEKTARRDLLFTQLWEQPDKYRGEPIRLRLHIKRALSHEAPENTADVKRVYEAWGWTEESKSFPYLVVFSELPPQMELGPDIQEEAVFVGYYLKLMSYQAFDVQRAAPLLVGRLQWMENPAKAILEKKDGAYLLPVAIGGGVLVLLVIGSWFLPSRRRRAAATQQPAPDLQWLEQAQAAVEGEHAEDGAEGNGHTHSDRNGHGRRFE